MFEKSALLVALILLTSSTAIGDSPLPEYSNRKESPNGKFLFVMISAYPAESDGKGYIEPLFSEIKKIRSTYPISGLYRNDGSTVPLWTVDWFAHQVEPLSDGIHIVRRGPWASSSLSEAVSFFAEDELTRTYTVADLVGDPEGMPHSVSHFRWRSYEWLNDSSKTYTIITKHNEYHLFNVTKGEIIISINLNHAIFGIAVFLVCSFSGYRWWRRAKNA